MLEVLDAVDEEELDVDDVDDVVVRGEDEDEVVDELEEVAAVLVAGGVEEEPALVETLDELVA